MCILRKYKLIIASEWLGTPATSRTADVNLLGAIYIKNFDIE